jgi:hypothetical protein
MTISAIATGSRSRSSRALAKCRRPHRAPLKPGEFILGYPDEDGPPANLPQPEILSRNGSYMAYRQLQEHVGRFRDFLREHGKTHEEQELIAAKLMGRWRSGAPLTLAPEKDDPALGADLQRNNDFNYKEMDPHGYAVPLGSHMRRMNPRDTTVNINRRRMIRRGATYGSHLPEDTPEDGVERGIAAFVICGSLIRQFEFAQNVWANYRNFHELGNERDPIIGNQDGDAGVQDSSGRSVRRSGLRHSRRFVAVHLFFRASSTATRNLGVLVPGRSRPTNDLDLGTKWMNRNDDIGWRDRLSVAARIADRARWSHETSSAHGGQWRTCSCTNAGHARLIREADARTIWHCGGEPVLDYSRYSRASASVGRACSFRGASRSMRWVRCTTAGARDSSIGKRSNGDRLRLRAEKFIFCTAAVAG